MKIKAKLESFDVLQEVHEKIRCGLVNNAYRHVAGGDVVAEMTRIVVDADGESVVEYSNGQRFRVSVKALGKPKGGA